MAQREKRLLVAVGVIALLLRVAGIGWGLPGAEHLSSYHPDEWQAVETALSMIARGSANPRFFNYPTLQPYLLALLLAPLLAAAPGAGIGLFYLLGRLVTVGFGVATVVLVGLIGRRLGGPRVGLVAAGLMAVLPLHVVNSHFATVDVALTAWCTAALLAAVAVADSPSWRTLLLGAAAAGAAAATKYHGALLLLPLWAAAGLAWRRQAAKPAAAAAAVAALVFAIASPYVLLDPAAWPQVRYELFEHPRVTNLFADVGPGWLFHLRWNLPTAAGGPVALAALIGLVVLARRRLPGALPVLVYGLVFGLSLLRTRELFIRYWLPLLPLVALGAAVAVAELRGRPAVMWLVLVAIAAGPALRSAAYVAMLGRPDARDEALAWCRTAIAPGETVGMFGSGGTVWFQAVPLQPNNGGARTGAVPAGGPYDLRLDPSTWPDDLPAWLVLNATQAAEEGRDLASLTSGYERVAEFENVARVLPGLAERGPGSRLHDWNYTRPRIEIWRLSSGSRR